MDNSKTKSRKSKIHKKSKKHNKHNSNNNITNANTNANERLAKLKARITRKDIRRFKISRAEKVINIIPKMIKFYNSLSPKEIMAVKYYKMWGSYFQTILLTHEKGEREIKFPFNIYEERDFRSDIIGKASMGLLPTYKSLDIKDINNYVKDNYTSRITLLNILDTVFSKQNCPKLTGNEILYRGMQLPESFKKYKEGDVFTFKNFISTTTDRSIAERYSNNSSLFVLTDLKDIPFIFMPNKKLNATTSKKYTELLLELGIMNDLSEHTLPRNLEFKINKIEKAYNTDEVQFIFDPQSNTTSFKNLVNVLKRKGLLNNDTMKEDNKELLEDEQKNEEKKAIIEKKLYPTITIYYCSFTKWHPRETIDYNKIMQNAKIVIDQQALDSWSDGYDS